MSNQTRDVCIAVLFFALIVSAMGIAAWLVVMGHPWFALLILVIICGTRMRTGDDKEKTP